ncbi:MAG: site-2 protease family protein [Acidimicrobiia bacterium]
MGGFLIVIGIILMVVIHEGAHFVAAKAFGMKATEAFFGFGPRLWSIRRGETEYGVKALPLGGYVRIIGMNPFEEVPPEDEGRTYRQQPFWQKSIVVLAGITSHFVVAFGLFWLVSVFWGTMLLPSSELSPTVTSVSRVLVQSDTGPDAIPLPLEAADEVIAIGGVPLTQLDPLSDDAPGDLVTVTVLRSGSEVALETTDQVVPTPAFLAGAAVGDKVIRVDDVEIDSWVRFTEAAQARPGVLTTVVVERDGAEVALTSPLAVRDLGTGPAGFFGVAPDDSVGPIVAVRVAVRNLGTSIDAATRGLVDLVSNFFEILGATVTSDDAVLDESRPISVIGLVRLSGPLESSIVLLAFVNVFVGVLNVVPLYPLDGGHFAVAAYEKVRRRPADVRKLLPVAAVVFVFILMLGLLGIYLDIFNPLEIPGQ